MNKYNEVEIQTAKNLLKQGYKWLARTFQGSVGAFSCKPCKKGGCWFYPSNLACTTGKTVTVSGKFTPLFQSIKWADNEPTYIEDIINPQILDDAEKQEVNRMDGLISRQAAIEVVDAVWSVTGDKNVAKVWDQIKDLPSAQPKQRWIPFKLGR